MQDSPEEQFSGPYGTGVYPGALDSIRAGNFDSDPAVEIVFGNLDGFVEMLEQKIPGPVGPLFVREDRTPPLGYGISALDVGKMDGNLYHVVCGTSQGRLFKIPINSNGAFGTPVELACPSNRGGFINWVLIGTFHGDWSENEILVQNERFEVVLYAQDGTELARTRRGHVPGLPDNFPGKCGKPAACFWPPVRLNETMVAFAPGADGRLRCICFDPQASDLRADVVSPEFRSHGRCTYIWSGPSGGPYVIVGGYDNGDPDLEDKCILTMIDPETSDILDQFDGYSGQGNFGPPMAIEKYSANQILVGHGRTVSVVNLVTDPEPGFSTSPPAPPYEQEIPFIPDAADYLEAGVDPPPGNYPEIGGVEIYTSGGGKCICVTAPTGRVWILSHTPIDFTRTTQELPRPPESEPTGSRSTARPWPVSPSELPAEVSREELPIACTYLARPRPGRHLGHLDRCAGRLG
ncbi:MAG: hypothetical protein AB1486_13750 [Planctomycetota bacterium]